MKRTGPALALIGIAASALLLVPQEPEAGPQWKILGPGGGGSMYRPTVSPHDPDTALVACDMTGAYITHDGGRSWREFNLRTRVDSFAFDPVDSKVVYAGSSGLFRSDDGGARWRLVFPNPDSGVTDRMVGDHAEHSFLSGDNWPGGAVQAIAIDPERTNRLYLGIQSAGLRLFYSADMGMTWQEGMRASGQNFRKLYIDPTSPVDARRLLVFTDAAAQLVSLPGFQVQTLALPEGIPGIQAADCGLDPGSLSPACYLNTASKWFGERLFAGILRSDDLGRSWREIGSGLEKELTPGGAPSFGALATCEKDARVVYLSCLNHPGATRTTFGIFKTENGGQSWDWSFRAWGSREIPENHTTGWMERSYGPSWGGAPLGLGVAPSDANRVYETNMGSASRSADGGRTWEHDYSRDDADGSSTTTGLDVTTCYGVHFDPFDEQHLVISYTDIGMAQSFNGGRTWRHTIEGVPRAWINTCYWVEFDPEAQGRAWSVWANAHDLPRPKMFRSGDFERFLGGVCRSVDGARTWQQSSEGMPANCVTTHIVLDRRSPVESRTLYAAGFGKGVYKSTDGGRTWQLKNNGISGNRNAWRLVLLPDGTLYLLVARGLANNVVIDGALYRSVDGAETWEAAPLPPGVNAPNDLVFDPAEPKRMYLSCWPRTINGYEQYGGVWATADGGASWRNIYSAAAHPYAVALQPGNSEVLYVNTFDGTACRSDDRGETWRRLEGYTFKWGHRPVPDPHHPGMLFLTTFGSSVWYGPAEGIPGAFEDIYPFTALARGVERPVSAPRGR